jgi:hypothetical protein
MERMNEQGIRPGVAQIMSGLGFEILAVPLVRSTWVTFVIEGIMGQIDEEDLARVIESQVLGVVEIEDLETCFDNEGIRDGKWTGRLTYENNSDHEAYEKHLEALKNWQQGKFQYKIRGHDIEYTLSSLPPCQICGS